MKTRELIIYYEACLRAVQPIKAAAAKTYTAGQVELPLIASHRVTPEDILLTLRELLKAIRSAVLLDCILGKWKTHESTSVIENTRNYFTAQTELRFVKLLISCRPLEHAFKYTCL
jgi:hypothetical protein